MMKLSNSVKLIVFMTMAFCSLNLFGQEKCLTMNQHNHLLNKDPQYRANREFIENFIEQHAGGDRSAGTVYTIPVVVHIIHKGSTLGTNENISDAQIYSAITSLNDAYRKVSGTTGFGNGVDTEIEFCLASKGPTGSPHSGINRVNGSSTSDYSTNGITSASGSGTKNETTIKALSKWDNTKYYNIWVVTEIDGNNAGSGTQGYAYFPGASSTYDGAVMVYNAFGYDPDGTKGYNLKSYTNRNRTLIHELGHGLDLYHTFEGDDSGTCPSNSSCSTQGDKICDTPPHKRSNSDCLTGTNTCTGTAKSLYIHNYMDYSSDDCQNEYTDGQRVRMQSAITASRASLVSATNLTASGCNGENIPVVMFSASNVTPCTGNSITFTDESMYAPTSWNWTFQGGTPSTSNLQNPSVIYNASGAYDVTLVATNAYGKDTLIKSAYINPVGGASIPFTEGFESVTFPPAGWNSTGQDTYDGSAWGVDGVKQWERKTTSGNGSSTASAAMNFFNYAYNGGSKDYLDTKPISLSGLTNPKLTFKVAHKYYPNVENYDELRVFISSDCGNTYGTEVYAASGSALGTASSSNTFSPTTSGDWKTVTIDLLSYGTSNVIVRFESTTKYGNNLFIDDVNISATASVSIAINSGGNPSCMGSEVSFIATPVNGGSSPAYQWKVNNVNFGTNSANFSSSTFNDGDVVTCVMTSSISGIIGSPATSGGITINRTSPAVASVSVSQIAGTNPTCAGTSLSFMATPVNGGTNPSYQWKINGNTIVTQTSPEFITGIQSDSDLVSCTMLSGSGCVTSSAQSDSIAIRIITPVIPENLRTVEIQDVSAMLRWEDIPGVSYKVRYKVAGTGIWLKYFKTTNGFLKLNGLDPSKEYTWSIRTFCGETYSDFSPGTRFKTIASPCIEPASVNAVVTSASTTDVNWTASTGGNVIRYAIVYRKSGEAWPTEPNILTQQTSATISSLESGATYEWKVRTICNYAGTSSSDWRIGQNFNMPSSKVASINNFEGNYEMDINPNPASEFIRINIREEFIGSALMVLDMKGSCVKNELISGKVILIDARDLPSGLYFIRANSGAGIISSKVNIVR